MYASNTHQWERAMIGEGHHVNAAILAELAKYASNSTKYRSSVAGIGVNLDGFI